ncbi:MAG: lipase [Gammaproteobacteria bacterium]|nr:MAG: lipase [Gammaproteobacteria bacterium]
MRNLIDNYTTTAIHDDILLTVFVHGWHHSAAPGDRNIESFKTLLGKMAENENAMSKRLNRLPRKILGVYIGWRGDSISIPYVNTTTFWDRKSVAQEVGLQGVTEVLLRLEQIVNVKIAQENVPRPQNSRMVTIGHSFGGAVLFTALQQVFADRFFDSNREKSYDGDAKGFGDLVLLINPAFESLRYSTLYDIAQEGCRRYFDSQMPLLAILTSQKDKATDVAFPLGRIFSTVFESHKPLVRHECTATGLLPTKISEYKADKTAVGHFNPYQTHAMTPRKQWSNLSTVQQFSLLQNQWASLDYGGTLDFSEVRLQHFGKTTPHNPYMNIYVDKKIMPDHNNIWRNELMSFIEEMVMVTTNQQPINVH